MKKLLALFSLVMTVSSAALAGPEVCYMLSKSDTQWSRTPDTLCLDNTRSEEYVITLNSGLHARGGEREFARFNMALLRQARCMDCNANVYGVRSPINTAFKDLSIHFNGKVNMATGAEAGTVSIGANQFYYRNNR